MDYYLRPIYAWPVLCLFKKSTLTPRSRYSSRRYFEALLFCISYLYHNPSGIDFYVWSEVGIKFLFFFPSHDTPVDLAFHYNSTVSFSYYFRLLLLLSGNSYTCESVFWTLYWCICYVQSITTHS